jgi:hypothetical protein
VVSSVRSRLPVGRAWCGTVLVLALLALLSAPGVAQASVRATGEGTTNEYDVTMVVQPDGTLQITEDITYAFFTDGHGLERWIPNRYPYPPDDQFQRVLTISNLQVSSPSGAPTNLKTQQDGDYLYVRIGDANELVSGTQRYVISYNVTGALNAFPDHVELYWNAVPGQWNSPILHSQVTVTAPAINEVACYAGPEGSSLPCDRAIHSQTQARFVSRDLGNGSTLTTVVGMPAGAVAVPPPQLERIWTIGYAFSAGGWHLPVAALALLAGLGAVVWGVWRRGRDRRYAGLTPGLLPPEGMDTAEEVRPYGASAEGPVEWTPTPGMRPGLVGTLVDESADALDVTATIVDLAVRGYLRIDEIPDGGLFRSKDWQLVRLKQADDQLLPYEAKLFDALFNTDGAGDGTTVKLSELKRHFASSLALVESRMYSEMVRLGWYRRSPRATRSAWATLAVVAIIVAAGITYLLARFTSFGFVGIALIVAAIAFLVASRAMPARTGRGSAALARALGFKRYLATAEAGQIKYEDSQAIFSRYLPYAIVFGVADHWVKVFSDLAASAPGGPGNAPVLPWYTGLTMWSLSDFNRSIGDFTSISAGSLTAVAAASGGGSGFGGGGFSGGGFGGGGGGGW